jgi:type VI secretion system protein ImpK
VPVALPPPAVVVPPPPRLATFLKQDIDAGLVSVSDLADKSIVTIKGDGFFEPGSAVIADRMLPLMGRIAAGLNAVPGQALVVGHTDSQPIRSVRYPSNWHLSEDRAKAVLAILAQTVVPQRLRAEGRADSEPVADNSSAAGRSRNRRVDITLLVSQPS